MFRVERERQDMPGVEGLVVGGSQRERRDLVLSIADRTSVSGRFARRTQHIARATLTCKPPRLRFVDIVPPRGLVSCAHRRSWSASVSLPTAVDVVHRGTGYPAETDLTCAGSQGSRQGRGRAHRCRAGWQGKRGCPVGGMAGVAVADLRHSSLFLAERCKSIMSQS